MKFSRSSLILFTLVASLCDLSHGQQRLQAEYLSTKLPTALTSHGAIYDGDDAIYLFGGVDNSTQPKNQILRFNIFSETIEYMGVTPSVRLTGNSLHLDSQGNIYHIGGNWGDTVIKYDPITNRSMAEEATPYNLQNSCSVKVNDSSNTIYIFGGDGDISGILKFDLGTLAFEEIGTLPMGIYSPTCGRLEGKVYLFGYTWIGSFFQIDLESLEVHQDAPIIPEIIGYGQTLVVGGYVYTIGGYQPTAEFPTGGIIQVDPETLQPNFIPVDNFPVGENESYFSTTSSAVFVEKLNRIYFFGGWKLNAQGTVNGGLDDIWFIDLGPLNQQ